MLRRSSSLALLSLALTLGAASACTDAGAELDDLAAEPEQKLILYGNLGTWGQIGLTENGRLLRSADEVADRYEEVCARARLESGLGDRLVCHADLIAAGPRGWVSGTERTARELIARHDPPITLDVRFDEKTTMAGVEAKVKALFEGKTAAVSKQFLMEHPVGLSLDLELQIVAGLRPTARQINRICTLQRDIMASYGHDPATLDCFLYEFAVPTMVFDPANLEPYVYPVLMSRADWDRTVIELRRDDVPLTDDNIRERALDIKERWIDIARAKYVGHRYGCMFVEAPYLIPGERDMFSFAEGLARFGDRCDVWSFQ